MPRGFRFLHEAACLQLEAQGRPRRAPLPNHIHMRAAILLLASLSLSAATAPADLRAHVEFLSSDLLQGRATPSNGLEVAAEYIAAQFRRARLDPQPDGTYFQIASDGHRNVIGVLRGSDPKLADTYVLVTAHYDHVAPGQEGTGDVIHNGANDNASGVATVMEIARTLSASKVKPKRTLVFIAFYGEEQGMLGSRFYAANPVFPIDRTVAQINFEQTGRVDDIDGRNLRTLNLTGFDYSEVGQILADAAVPLKVRVTKRPKWSDEAFTRSDNEALAAKGVPAHTAAVTFMFPDYHRPGDEWNKLDYDNMALVTNAAAAGVLALANRVQAPRWYVGAPYGGASATAMSRPEPRPAKAKAPASRVVRRAKPAVRGRAR